MNFKSHQNVRVSMFVLPCLVSLFTLGCVSRDYNGGESEGSDTESVAAIKPVNTGTFEGEKTRIFIKPDGTTLSTRNYKDPGTWKSPEGVSSPIYTLKWTRPTEADVYNNMDKTKKCNHLAFLASDPSKLQFVPPAGVEPRYECQLPKNMTKAK